MLEPLCLVSGSVTASHGFGLVSKLWPKSHNGTKLASASKRCLCFRLGPQTILGSSEAGKTPPLRGRGVEADPGTMALEVTREGLVVLGPGGSNGSSL